MSLSPIAYTIPNYRDFKNYWLKAYEPGTTTPKPMSFDVGGTVEVAKVELDKDGFPASAGGALVIPYIQGSYDLWAFPTEEDADNNDTSNAERFADNITGIISAAKSVIGNYTLAEAKALTGAVIGQQIRITDRGNGQFEFTSPEPNNEANLIENTGSGLTLKLITSDIIYAEQFGIFGNNAGAPYSDSFIVFMNYSGNNEVVEAIFPNRVITFDNTVPASFQSNCTYTGGRNTFIQPTQNNQRVFLAQNKTNFEINKIRSYIGEDAGFENTYIGGGYWRFEGCSYFDINHCEVSRSFGTGFKFVGCIGFNLKNPRANFNQFTGCEMEGCNTYTVEDYDFSFNGRYSSDQTYKPLPSGWTGTHGGRGITVAANGDDVDQNYARIQKGRCQKNSEYNFRAFTANTKGIKNLILEDFLFEDAGAPAGTYGTIVLGADKGVDCLINSDATGESDNVQVRNGDVNRSFGYGVHVSVDGYNHKLFNIKARCTGAAINAISTFQLFGAKELEMDGCRSINAQYHISFGSNNPQDITIINDIAKGCLKYMNGNAVAGINLLRNVKAYHASATAISGEDGISLNGAVQWQLEDSLFQGFHIGVIAGSSATDLEFNRVITKSSVSVGLRDFSPGGSGIIYNNCQFDSANPTTRGSQVGGAGDNSQWAVGISWSSAMITTGYYKAGHIVWKVNPGAVDGTHSRYLAGWHRLTTGTSHTLNTDWREMWIHDNAITA